jgi:2-oxoisovalerate dehydrogenase E1 component alpha subunit
MRGKPTAAAEKRTTKIAVAPGLGQAAEFLPAATCLEVHRHMVRARVVEERMIKMSKSGEGFFWIGGPGEEAFNVPLGMQVKKGCGPAFDYLYFHYRSSATMIAMGMTLVDLVRQMAMTATDPHSLGRNFPGHFARKEWNVPPVTSVVATQFAKAPGTAHVQKRHGGDGITIVVGGDAGTQEGDFQTCLNWSARPGNELPVLMIVSNNHWGISTPAAAMHAEKHIADRGKPLGIRSLVADGNDPIASWFALREAMEYCRGERRPFLLEAMVSRLYGHSSSSGAPRSNEPDCLLLFEKRLLDEALLKQSQIDQVYADAEHESTQAVEQVLKEARPKPEDVETFTYAPSPVDAVYPGDYTGLPRETLVIDPEGNLRERAGQGAETSRAQVSPSINGTARRR